MNQELEMPEVTVLIVFTMVQKRLPKTTLQVYPSK
jgi:hypothetical protein